MSAAFEILKSWCDENKCSYEINAAPTYLYGEEEVLINDHLTKGRYSFKVDTFRMSDEFEAGKIIEYSLKSVERRMTTDRAEYLKKIGRPVEDVWYEKTIYKPMATDFDSIFEDTAKDLKRSSLLRPATKAPVENKPKEKKVRKVANYGLF